MKIKIGSFALPRVEEIDSFEKQMKRKGDFPFFVEEIIDTIMVGEKIKIKNKQQNRTADKITGIHQIQGRKLD